MFALNISLMINILFFNVISAVTLCLVHIYFCPSDIWGFAYMLNNLHNSSYMKMIVKMCYKYFELSEKPKFYQNKIFRTITISN